MTTNQLDLSNPMEKGTGRRGGWWMSAVLILVAALAITAGLFLVRPKAPSQPTMSVQSVPDAASQGIASYIRAHKVGHVETTGDAGPVVRSQSVPDAASQGVSSYLAAHSAGVWAQTVPDAAAQGVLNYLLAHGADVK